MKPLPSSSINFRVGHHGSILTRKLQLWCGVISIIFIVKCNMFPYIRVDNGVSSTNIMAYHHLAGSCFMFPKFGDHGLIDEHVLGWEPPSPVIALQHGSPITIWVVASRRPSQCQCGGTSSAICFQWIRQSILKKRLDRVS